MSRSKVASINGATTIEANDDVPVQGNQGDSMCNHLHLTSIESCLTFTPMRRMLLWLSLAAIAGCSGSDKSTPEPEAGAAPAATTTMDSAPTTDPVPTPPPNAPEQTPAFPEQTRAPLADSGVNLQVTEVAGDLSHPWAIEFLPDGRLIMTLRSGELLIVSRQGEVSEPITGVPEVDTRGQGGLLDVALSPNFGTDRLVYFSYAEPRADGETGTAVARGRLSEDGRQLQNVEVIFQQQPSWDSTLHYGSRLVWDNDGLLYVTLGERSLPEPRQLAQQLDAHLGKVVRINADGSIPADNPFASGEQGLPEIWSYGHRNIQGADLHPETGRLWTIEHGPKGGDELNAPEAGKNYGWPIITYGEDYSGEPIGDGITSKPGMEQPLYYWDPVIAPGGMLFYEGVMFPEWQGNLLISSLNPGGLVRIQLDGVRVTGEERFLPDVGRVRDVKQDAEGGLWVVTDHNNGRLLHVTRGGG